MWTSWFVLAACAVITQSFPRPDEEYQIPDVTFGRRAQYYVLHDDGDFKYGYNTGDGAYESAVKMGSGDLTGFYGYNDAFGDNVRLDYTAGVGGFVPRSSLLPVAPEVGAAAVRSAGPGFTAGGASGVIPKSTAPSRPFEAADVRSANNLDGSYSFSYDNSDSSRSESADSSNNVVGHYSFVAEDGQNRQISYRAGSGSGFVAEGSHLPVAPEVPLLSTPTTYTAPVQTIVKSAPTSPVLSHEEASIRSGASADGGYAFSYTNPDSSRSESADANNNVVGQYSFVADDGVNHEIRYRAGSATGYVAEGDSLPVAPEAPAAAAATATATVHNAPAPAILSTLYSAPSPSTNQQNSIIKSSSSGVASFRGQGVPGDITFGSDSGNDGSYSFSYTNPDSSRSESADSDLNVRGDYSFIADDGIERQIRYIAGAGTGFVAEGAHLPVPVSDTSPGATSGNAGSQKAYSGNAGSQKAYSGNAGSQKVYSGNGGTQKASSAGSVTGTGQTSVSTSSSSGVASFRGQGVPGDITFGSDSGNDGSYSFSYTNPDSSRSESADSDLNVRGDYSFIADDGIRRQVHYRAGSGTGFVAEGAHLPVPVSDISSGATSGNAGSQKAYSAGSVTGTGQTSVSTSSSSGVASFRGQGVPGDITFGSDSGNDGSYSFSYTNPDSSRSESADSDLNVRGDYSFIADDGIRRQVHYRAGSGTGFVAEGAHLPVPVSDTSSGATSGNAGSQKAYSGNAGSQKAYSGNAGSQKAYSAGLVTGADQTSVSTSSSSGGASFRGQGVPGDIIFGSDSGNDGSYSFSYTNPDSSRSEAADASNNVVGEYSFIADDGQNRQIRYRAGSGTGFVAEGDSIPVASDVPVVQQKSSATVRSEVQASSGYTYQAPSVSFSAPSQAASTRSSSSSSSSVGHLLGNVFVRQYPVERGRSKFGYVFTEV